MEHEKQETYEELMDESLAEPEEKNSTEFFFKEILGN